MLPPPVSDEGIERFDVVGVVLAKFNVGKARPLRDRLFLQRDVNRVAKQSRTSVHSISGQTRGGRCHQQQRQGCGEMANESGGRRAETATNAPSPSQWQSRPSRSNEKPWWYSADQTRTLSEEKGDAHAPPARHSENRCSPDVVATRKILLHSSRHAKVRLLHGQTPIREQRAPV